MKRLILLPFMALFVCSALAQSREELYEKFMAAISERDSTSVLSLISDWEKLFPNDAELYSVKANYYFQNAVDDVIVMSETAPTDGRECFVVENSSGVKAYMFSELQIDSVKLDSAKETLAEGISKNLDRIDLRLGKVTIHLYVQENSLAVQEIQSALEHSIKNDNKWIGTLDSPVETDGISYLRDCIQEYLSQLLNANDIVSAEKMIDTCIQLYPDEAIFLSDKGTLRFYADDLKNALEWFLKARELAPDDMLITNNIANLYEKQGDKENALKYYHIIADGNDEYFAEIARTAIQELNAGEQPQSTHLNH